MSIAARLPRLRFRDIGVRIERGRDMLAADHVRLRGERRRLIASFNDRLSPYDALLMPTVAKVVARPSPTMRSFHASTPSFCAIRWP
jgi:Asp-tRNA(Asn)/Glu-tRNA(Gln) amidotransferase A subunit family amidase